VNLVFFQRLLWCCLIVCIWCPGKSLLLLLLIMQIWRSGTFLLFYF